MTEKLSLGFHLIHLTPYKNQRASGVCTRNLFIRIRIYANFMEFVRKSLHIHFINQVHFANRLDVVKGHIDLAEFVRLQTV